MKVVSYIPHWQCQQGPFRAVRGLSSEDAQACLCITSQIPGDMGRSIWRIDMDLSKLWEIVEDRGAWHAAIRRVAKSHD